MKSIVQQLKDYLFLSDEENSKLRDDVEKLTEEIEELNKLKMEKEKAADKLKEKESGYQEEISKLKDALRKEEDTSNEWMERHKICEKTMKELQTDKSYLEEKVRNCNLADERSEQILQLTDSNKKISEAMHELQMKLDECSDEKVKIEDDLRKKAVQFQQKECDILELQRNKKAVEDKVDDNEQQIATLTQKLRLCQRANEISDLERRRSQEDNINANATIAELENKLSKQLTYTEKYKEEVKSKLSEIRSLEGVKDTLQSGLGELQSEKEELSLKLSSSETKNAVLSERIKEEQERGKQCASDLEKEKKCLHDVAKRCDAVEKQAAQVKLENRDLLYKVGEANNLITESKRLSESKMSELQHLFEEYRCLSEKATDLKRAAAHKDEALEASKSARQHEKSEASKTILKLKKALKYLHKENKKSKELQATFEETQTQLKNEVADLTAKLASSTSDMKTKEKENEKLQDQIKEQWAKTEENEHTNKTLRRSLGKVKAENTTLKNEIKSIMAERERLVGVGAEKDGKIKKMTKSENEMRKRMESLQADCNKYKDKIGHLEEAYERNSNLISTEKTHMQSLIDENNQLTLRIHEMDNRLERAKDVESERKEDLDTTRAEKENLSKECEQLSKTNHESITFIKALENDVKEYNKKVSSLVEVNSKLKLENHSIAMEAKDAEKEHRKLKEVAEEKDKEMMRLTIANEETQRRLSDREVAVTSLQKQLNDSMDMYTNLKNNFKALSHDKDLCEKRLQETEMKLQDLCKEQRTAEVTITQLKSKLETMTRSHDAVKKKYMKGKEELKKSGQDTKKLRMQVTKLEKENEGLSLRVSGNISHLKELEESYKSEKFRAENGSKGQGETIEILREELKKRGQEFESLGQDYKNISKEMLEMKMTHAKTLRDVLNQRYIIGELTGSHQYEHTLRKKLQKVVDAKEEELFGLKKKLVWHEQELSAIKGLFDGERGMRLQMDNDIRRVKSMYDELEEEKFNLANIKDEMEQELKENVSQLQNCLYTEKSSKEEMKVELERKTKETEKYLNELAVKSNEVDRLEKKIADLQNRVNHQSEQYDALEKRMRHKTEEIEGMVKTVDDYRNKISLNECKLDDMQLKLEIKEQEKCELEKTSSSKDMEKKLLAKEKLSLLRRTNALEERIKEVEENYKIRCGEEYELRESLKNARSEYKKLLEEKETVEEMKHSLELKLLQSVVGHKSTERGGDGYSLRQRDLTEQGSKYAPMKLYSSTDIVLDQTMPKDHRQFDIKQSLEEFPSIFDDSKVRDFHGIGKTTFKNEQDRNEDDEIAAMLGLCAKSPANRFDQHYRKL